MAVVTGLAIAAVGTAASIGMNLSAAAKQSKAQSAAEQAAADAAAKAESEYQREFAGGVQLPMEAYQQAGREGTAQQMQALQALQEADTRSLAAGVGKVQAAATAAQTGITEQMRQDLFSLESTQMQEKMSNRDQIARMNEERAVGAQKAAANAEAAKTAAITSAISGVTSLAGQVVQAAPLFKKGKEDLSGISQITPSGFAVQQAPAPTSGVSSLRTPGASYAGVYPSTLSSLKAPVYEYPIGQQQIQQSQYDYYNQ